MVKLEIGFEGRKWAQLACPKNLKLHKSNIFSDKKPYVTIF